MDDGSAIAISLFVAILVALMFTRALMTEPERPQPPEMRDPPPDYFLAKPYSGYHHMAAWIERRPEGEAQIVYYVKDGKVEVINVLPGDSVTVSYTITCQK